MEICGLGLTFRLGIHQTGCVVGALRVLQDWNFASILVEVSIYPISEGKLMGSIDHMLGLEDIV
jgi:hypothetical protein